MKTIIRGITAILIACTILFIGTKTLERAQGLTSGNTLRIYNWGDYIDPGLIQQFEDETGYAVSYETFDSNEAMYTKINQGGTAYDLAVPSEYMISKMIEEDMLIPLDHSKIKGLDNIAQEYLNQPFDPDNKFSIPYFWGTLGIVYNTDYVEEGEITSWADLWKKDYDDSILIIDGAREVMGIGLLKAGYSQNTRDEDILNQVAEDLKKLMPNVKALLADEIKMYMIQEEAGIAVSYSGEAADMLYENEKLRYLLPDEGSNLWFDNIVIPKTSQNTEAAYAFINFMLRPESAAQNADYIGYSTPNEKALEILDPEIIEDENFYPPESELERMEVYENLGAKWIELYNDLFLEIKMIR